MKYLTCDLGFFTWIGELSHADMAKRLGAIRVRSAGFIHLSSTGAMVCEGRSESLNVDSLAGDSALANRIFAIK